MRSFQATERIVKGIRGHSTCEDGQTIYLRAETIEEAAQHAVNRLVSRRAIAWRVTGDHGLSGVFQGYRSCKGGGVMNLTSIGPNIHVMELN